jgi:hypothetical protein
MQMILFLFPKHVSIVFIFFHIFILVSATSNAILVIAMTLSKDAFQGF